MLTSRATTATILNRLDTDPSNELVALPVNVIDVSGLITQGCLAREGNLARGSSEFSVTGRGGLPPNPSETVRSETALVDCRNSRSRRKSC